MYTILIIIHAELDILIKEIEIAVKIFVRNKEK